MSANSFKMIVLTLALAAVIAFAIWFVPVFAYGISSTPERQKCRFDGQTQTEEFTNVIQSVAIDSPDPGAIKFTFIDEFEYVKPLGFFRSRLDSISPGDTITKEKGKLYLTIKNKYKTFDVSLKYGCDSPPND